MDIISKIHEIHLEAPKLKTGCSKLTFHCTVQIYTMYSITCESGIGKFQRTYIMNRLIQGRNF